MVDLLVRLHSGKELGFDVIVGPADIEVEVGDRVGLQPPFIFFGNVLYHCVLCFCMLRDVPLTLMTTLCFLVLIWFLYAADRMLSVKVPSNESESFYIQKKVDNLNNS